MSAEAAEFARSRSWLTIRNALFVIETPYQAAIVAAIRTVPGRKWDSAAKRWTVPLGAIGPLQEAAIAIDRLIGQTDWKPAPREKASSRRDAPTGIVLFTDGACSGNPGPGGWAVVVDAPEGRREISGGEPDTTNNRMELRAAIAALESVPGGSRVEIRTDSRYVLDGITRWISGWKNNNWKTQDRKPVKNAELWQRLDAARETKTVTWTWVKGHAGHRLNERADDLARREIGKLRGDGGTLVWRDEESPTGLPGLTRSR